MADKNIIDVLGDIRRCWFKLYPNRNIGMINARYAMNGVCALDTGVCYGVAMVAQDILKRLGGNPVEIVYLYVWSGYEDNEDYLEDLVHSVLFDGKCFYDAVNYTGVSSIEDLHFVKGLSSPTHCFARYPERGDLGGTEKIENHFTDRLLSDIECAFGFPIPRRTLTI